MNILLKELEGIDVSNQDLEIILNSYNNSFQEVISSMYENTITIQQFLCQIAVVPTNLEESSSSTANVPVESDSENEYINLENSIVSSDITPSTTEDCTSSTVELMSSKNNYIENTLIISENRKKVILPYKIENLKEKLLQNQDLYSSLDDVIDKQVCIHYRKNQVVLAMRQYNLLPLMQKVSMWEPKICPLQPQEN